MDIDVEGYEIELWEKALLVALTSSATSGHVDFNNVVERAKRIADEVVRAWRNKVEPEESIVAERNRLIIAVNSYRGALVQLKEVAEWAINDAARKPNDVDRDMFKALREAVVMADAALSDPKLRRP